MESDRHAGQAVGMRASVARAASPRKLDDLTGSSRTAPFAGQKRVHNKCGHDRPGRVAGRADGRRRRGVALIARRREQFGSGVQRQHFPLGHFLLRGDPDLRGLDDAWRAATLQLRGAQR